jgi:hypothetical protein
MAMLFLKLRNPAGWVSTTSSTATTRRIASPEVDLATDRPTINFLRPDQKPPERTDG